MLLELLPLWYWISVVLGLAVVTFPSFFVDKLARGKINGGPVVILGTIMMFAPFFIRVLELRSN